ncbi:MAG: hypothetical protein WHU94_01435 [Thermogemmata sp.]
MTMPSMVNGEVLQAARGMSAAMLGTWVTLGLALWLFGWRWHRFWITCVAAFVAAAITWHWGSHWTRTPPVISAIVIGLATAMIAVELARLVVLGFGGITLLYLANQLLSDFRDIWLAFPLGGLVAVLLFRIGWILATTLLGTWITIHALLLLIESVSPFDSVQWFDNNAMAIHIGIIIWIVIGIICQLLIDSKSNKSKLTETPETTHVSVLIPVENQHADSWWKRWFSKRQAVLKV